MCDSYDPHHPTQDAHEFLNYLLNQAAEILEDEAKKEAVSRGLPPPAQPVTWVHEIFQGKLVGGFTAFLRC